MESILSKKVQAMARTAGPKTSAGDGGVPARNPVQPLLCTGGYGHRGHDGDNGAYQGN